MLWVEEKSGQACVAGFCLGVFQRAYGDPHHTFLRLMGSRKTQLAHAARVLQLLPELDLWCWSYNAFGIEL
ncbi:hypothetical protein T440DRAFT_116920 [Plenodomus tracheiphilus IPT5]|uniref:Uncharacterized protein n=1 Tax=Plenodomus tracheiphilus IPT5 TaxID=1408161 RepID=A0A6A7ALF5_9PLEO|nr:hypothetical protein T440DRAFT_116920 [Plenodomus tracheiphilus IPT5]